MLEILLLLGILNSCYAYSVSISNKKQVCDLNKNISCSKALKSKTAYFFKIHNSLLGIGYYVLVFIILYHGFYYLMLILSSLAVLFSVYLALELFKQKNACLVCIFSYLINILILLVIIK